MFKRAPKHEHMWQELGKQYVKPGVTKFSGFSEEVAQEIMYGVTFITLKCSVCGYIENKKVLGQVALEPGKRWT